MVCGLFTRYKTDEGKEFLAQIDGINTETNNFHELQAKIQGKMEIYSPTIPNVKIIYVAVYPDGYHFEDISNPKLVSQHFSHKDTDRAKGALIFGKNKANGNFGDYIEIEENQKSEIKVMKDLPVSHSTTPSMRSLSRSSNIQTVVENVYQKNQQQKNIVGIDVGTMTCRAAIIDNKNDIIEKCGIVTMESKVTFSENQTNTYFEEEEANDRYDENEIDAKINQENTVFDIPHFMGKRIDQIIENQFLPFKIQKNRDFIKIQLQNNLILPEVACGELLKFIVRKIDEKLKFETTQISLITPIFNDSESKKRYETALKCAAQLASLKVVNFLDSSTAALIDYIFKHTKNLIIGSFNIGVIDIGGSNLNIAVYNVNTNKDGFWLKEIVKYGNSKFGGRNVDILLAQDIKTKITEITGSYNGGEFDLLTKAEQMKIQLSTYSSADYIHEKTSMTFKRDKEFQACIKTFLETLKNELKIVKDQIKEENCKFLLIGNTCKIPAIKETIKKNFPNSVDEMNLSSAKGAAIHTAKLQKSYDKISYYKY
uniref:Heat shock protein 70 n=1 Tax=Panagrolaimus sp. ES5 TaxID=591445 RepID=A0AC34F9J7_9BILA